MTGKSIRQRWHDFRNNQPLKDRLYSVIFESDTPAGKTFDIALIVAIAVSIVVTMFDSLVSSRIGTWALVVLEYLFTIFFTLEYLARLYCSPNPRRYALSFFGIIDLISILPMYMGFFLHGARFMIILRSFRLIRIFRIFKLFTFLDEGYRLLSAIRQSLHKILVFFLFVVIMVISLGTLMYIIEGGQPGTQFSDIPTSIYWAVVTMTTVGYGDIAPITALGRLLSAVVMLLGYTILAVPTGIVSAEMIKEANASAGDSVATRICPNCGKQAHARQAHFCDRCGSGLEDDDIA